MNIITLDTIVIIMNTHITRLKYKLKKNILNTNRFIKIVNKYTNLSKFNKLVIYHQILKYQDSSKYLMNKIINMLEKPTSLI